jgi:hypothetical protein
VSRRKIKAGSTSVAVPLFVQDTTSTVGAGLGSLVFNTSGLAAKYRREGQTTWTTISLADASVGTWTSGGFKADGGPVTGGYEFGVPDAALAAGAKWAEVAVYGAANMLAVLLEFELDAVDYQDAAKFGLTDITDIRTRLPAALGANGNMKASVIDWKEQPVPNPNVAGVPKADVCYAEGEAVQTEDFTLAGATAATVTLPVLDSAGNVITDDGHLAWAVVLVVGGTGEGQILLLSTPTANSREYTVDAGMVTPCDATSRCFVGGTWRANATRVAGFAQSAGDVYGAAAAAEADAATLVGRLTTTRAANLDNLTAAPLSAAATRSALGLASANLDTQLDNIPTNSDLATAVVTGLTTALAEGYRGAGATGSVRDLLYEVIGHLGESAISGATKTVKKLDGVTPAKTYTLDSATSPTAISEAS